MSRPSRDWCLHADATTPWRRHGKQQPHSSDRDHRHLREPGEEDEPKDARAGTGGGGSDVALPRDIQGLDGVRPEGRLVEPAGSQPGVVRGHGRGRRRGLQLLPGPPLLHDPQPRAGRDQGAGGAAVAGVRRLHTAGAQGHGVCRGDEPDPADSDRRDVRRAALGAWRARAPRADREDRRDEHERTGQRRSRHPVAGVLGVLRPGAAGDPIGARRRVGMTDDPFLTHRSLLFTVAYEMLGSAADAEDVVQETWLRWAEVDPATVHDPRAYLVRIVTRQALNRLRTLARRREDYVGEWLPEPLLTSPDVAEDVELAESVSIAMLTVLETLGPTERAVLVLHEVFDVPYDEIAEA